MTESIRDLLKLQPGEGPKALHFALLGALLQAGIAIGMSTGDALFLSHVGVGSLPYIYLLTPVLMLLYIPAYSYLLTRYGTDRVFQLTLGVLVAGGVAFFLLLSLFAAEAGAGQAVYWMAKLYAVLWYIALYSLFWNFVDDYFDILDAKRLFSLFAAGSAAGAIVGGALVSLLTRYVGVAQLYLAWALLAVLTFPVLIGLARRWPKLEVEAEGGEEAPVVEQLRHAVGVLRRSRYILLLILVLFTVLVLTTLTEYQYYEIFSARHDERSLARLLGTLFAVVSVFNVAVNLFLFNRLVLRFGVSNVALIQPVTYLVVFTLLLLQGGQLAAVAGFFAYHGILTAIDYNNVNLLYNGIPQEVKRSVRTFIEGLAEPLSTAVGGLFLLVWARRLSPEQVATLGLAGAGVYLGLVLLLRSSYGPTIVANLKRGWLDFSRPEREVLGGLGDAEVASLVERARLGERDTALAALRILWLERHALAAEVLLEYLALASPADRAAARPLLGEMLRAGDAEVTRLLLQWLDAHLAELEPALLEEFCEHGLLQPRSLHRLLESSDPDDRAVLAVARARSWNAHEELQALGSIRELLEGDAAERRAGVRVLGRTGEEKYAYFLVPFLRDPEGAVRHEAIHAMHRLVTPSSSRVIAPLLECVAGADVEGRTAVLSAVAKIGDVGSIGPLLRALEFLNPAERREVEKMMVGFGLQSVPTTVAVLRDPTQRYSARSVAARVLGKLAFPQYEALAARLLRAEIARSYRYLHHHLVLGASGDASPGVGVLARFHRDIQQRIVDFVLELLSIGGRLPSYELLSASLRSPHPKERANAIETIEEGVPRDLFRLLYPLVDSTRTLPERVAAYAGRLGPVPETVEGIVEQAFASPFGLECAAAAQALWDLRGRDAAGELRRHFSALPFPLFRETALSLVGRENGQAPLNTVERIDRLARAPFFHAFITDDLGQFARHAVERRYPEGEVVLRAGEPARSLLLLLGGGARSGSRSWGPGSTLGEGAVLGTRAPAEDVVSTGATALAIPGEAILRAAGSRPGLALGLLSRRLGVSHAG